MQSRDATTTNLDIITINVQQNLSKACKSFLLKHTWLLYASRKDFLELKVERKIIKIIYIYITLKKACPVQSNVIINFLSTIINTPVTLTVATASTAPAAPSRWPTIDFVEFILSCNSLEHVKNSKRNYDKGLLDNYLRIPPNTSHYRFKLLQISSWSWCCMCIYIINIFSSDTRLS